MCGWLALAEDTVFDDHQLATWKHCYHSLSAVSDLMAEDRRGRTSWDIIRASTNEVALRPSTRTPRVRDGYFLMATPPTTYAPHCYHIISRRSLTTSHS